MIIKIRIGIDSINLIKRATILFIGSARAILKFRGKRHICYCGFVSLNERYANKIYAKISEAIYKKVIFNVGYHNMTKYKAKAIADKSGILKGQ